MGSSQKQSPNGKKVSRHSEALRTASKGIRSADDVSEVLNQVIMDIGSGDIDLRTAGKLIQAVGKRMKHAENECVHGVHYSNRYKQPQDRDPEPESCCRCK